MYYFYFILSLEVTIRATEGNTGMVMPMTAVKTSGRSRAASYASWAPQSCLAKPRWRMKRLKMYIDKCYVPDWDCFRNTSMLQNTQEIADHVGH